MSEVKTIQSPVCAICTRNWQQGACGDCTLTRKQLDAVQKLQEEISKTYKAWVGRDYMHLPLSDAVGAIVTELYKEIESLKAESLDAISTLLESSEMYGDDKVTVMTNTHYAELKAERDRYRELMQEFCDRVDKGEVRSKKTYAKFREALKGE